MARLYADENFPLPVVEVLRELGQDVLTVSESGKAGQRVPDEVILAFAVEEKRTLLTLNRKHFIALHSQKPAHWGIIVCTVDPDFSGQAQRIHKIVNDHPDMRGLLLRVQRPLE